MIISVVHMDDSGSWARIGLIVVFLRRKKYQRKIYKYFLDDIILQLILIFSRFVSFLGCKEILKSQVASELNSVLFHV